MAQWQQHRREISREGLMALFENRCAYIAIENFIAPEECEKLIGALRAMGLQQYQYSFNPDEAPPAAHLFTTHYLFEDKKPEEYFPEAAKSIAEYGTLTKKIGMDPVKKIMDLLQHHLQKSVRIAEQDGRAYSYVIARELNHSVLLHADFAHFLPAYWEISKVIAQYAWNIYLSDPGEGGETIIFNKPWEKSDDQHILHGTYGYDPSLVANTESVAFHPSAGSLMFFNSRNFHEVKKCQHPRLSIGGHIGLTAQDDIILWV